MALGKLYSIRSKEKLILQIIRSGPQTIKAATTTVAQARSATTT